MRGNTEAEEVMEDIFIASWADDLLKKGVPGHNVYHLSAKMRLCFRFVKVMRNLNERYTDISSCLKPDAFNNTIEACRTISKFDKHTKTYGSGSNALQLMNYLKQICYLTTKTSFWSLRFFCLKK